MHETLWCESLILHALLLWIIFNRLLFYWEQSILFTKVKEDCVLIIVSLLLSQLLNRLWNAPFSNCSYVIFNVTRKLFNVIIGDFGDFNELCSIILGY